LITTRGQFAQGGALAKGGLPKKQTEIGLPFVEDSYQIFCDFGRSEPGGLAKGSWQHLV